MPDRFDDIPARALAVFAHPDDPEMACGGTLARWAEGGCEVMVLVAANGDKGSVDPKADPRKVAARRAKEVAAAAAVLGASSAEILRHGDGQLAGAAATLREELVGAVRSWRPDVVVCPDPTAVFFGDAYVNHADHRAVGWAVLDAAAPAAALPLYFPDRGPPHQVSTLLLSGTLEPDVWVDVAATVDRKVEAVLCHASQLAADAAEWLPAFVRARAEEEGRRVGLGPAESFRRINLAR